MRGIPFGDTKALQRYLDASPRDHVGVFESVLHRAIDQEDVVSIAWVFKQWLDMPRKSYNAAILCAAKHNRPRALRCIFDNIKWADASQIHPALSCTVRRPDECFAILFGHSRNNQLYLLRDLTKRAVRANRVEHLRLLLQIFNVRYWSQLQHDCIQMSINLQNTVMITFMIKHWRSSQLVSPTLETHVVRAIENKKYRAAAVFIRNAASMKMHPIKVSPDVIAYLTFWQTYQLYNDQTWFDVWRQDKLLLGAIASTFKYHRTTIAYALCNMFGCDVVRDAIVPFLYRKAH